MAANSERGSRRPGEQRPPAGSGAGSKREGETVPNRGAVVDLPEQFGRYRIQKKLGGGGMGAVYLAHDTELDREVALKVPHFSDGDPEVRERFLREARSAAKLDHPNLCPVFDVGVLDGVYYLTMKYLKGHLLSVYAGLPQPPRKVVEVVAKLAQALESAHVKGVIHRDLKPDNVMMCGSIGPTVMDFGLAKQTKQQDQMLTQAGTMMGTPAYMPPEQLQGQLERIGPRSDIYTLGVIFFQLLTGRLPFEGATTAEVFGKILYTEASRPSQVRPGLNPTLDAICGKATAKAPEQRYASMKLFAAALIEYLKATPATEGAASLIPNPALAGPGNRSGVLGAQTVPPGQPPSGAAPAAGSGNRSGVLGAQTVPPGRPPSGAAPAPAAGPGNRSGVLGAQTVPPGQSPSGVRPAPAGRDSVAGNAMIAGCPSCQAKCQLPANPGDYKVTCPTCRNVFVCRVPPRTAPEEPLSGLVPGQTAVPPAPSGSFLRGSGAQSAADFGNLSSSSGPAEKAPTTKTVAPSPRPAIPKGESLPLLDELAQPSGGGGRRWLTLICLVVSVLSIAASAVLATGKLRKLGRDSNRPELAVSLKESDAPKGAAPLSVPPIPPANPAVQLYGGIEIGAKGIKAVVVRVREGRDGLAVDLAVPAQTANTTLVRGLKETGILPPEAIEDTTRVVRNFQEGFRNEHKIPAERIHICASSGLFAPIADRSDLVATNKEHLAAAIRKATRLEVGFVDATREMQLSYKGCVPAAHMDESLLIDVGSGGTKVSYSDGGGARIVSVGIPFGSVSLAEEVERQMTEQGEKGGPFSRQLIRVLKESEKMDRLREASKRDPGLANQRRLCLVGGVVWALATIQRPAERGPYTTLTSADVDAFIRRLEESPKDALPAPEGLAGLDAAVRQEVENDLRRVRKTFKREQLLAGARLLQTLHAELGAKSEKEMLFARNGYLGLAIGYVLHARGKAH